MTTHRPLAQSQEDVGGGEVGAAEVVDVGCAGDPADRALVTAKKDSSEADLFDGSLGSL